MAAADLQAHAQRLALAPDLVELAHLARRLVAGHGLAAGEEAQPPVPPRHRLQRARHAEEARAAADAAVLQREHVMLAQRQVPRIGDLGAPFADDRLQPPVAIPQPPPAAAECEDQRRDRGRERPPSTHRCGRHGRRHPLHKRRLQAGEIRNPAGIAERERVAVGQPAQGRRQRLGRGHRRPADQHRNQGFPRGERELDLAAHVVAGIVEPTPAPVARVEPARTDHHQHRLHLLQGLLDDHTEIGPCGDVVDIAEHAVGAEAAFERVGEPPGEAGAVVAAVGDEDLGHGAAKRGEILHSSTPPAPPPAPPPNHTTATRVAPTETSVPAAAP